MNNSNKKKKINFYWVLPIMAVATGCKPVASCNTTDGSRSVVVQLRLFHFGKEEQPVVVWLCPKRQKNRTGPDFQTLAKAAGRFSPPASSTTLSPSMTSPTNRLKSTGPCPILKAAVPLHSRTAPCAQRPKGEARAMQHGQILGQNLGQLSASKMREPP